MCVTRVYGLSLCCEGFVPVLGFDGLSALVLNVCVCVHGGSDRCVFTLGPRSLCPCWPCGLFPSCVLSGACPFLVQRVVVRVGSEACGPPS